MFEKNLYLKEKNGIMVEQDNKAILIALGKSSQCSRNPRAFR